MLTDAFIGAQLHVEHSCTVLSLSQVHHHCRQGIDLCVATEMQWQARSEQIAATRSLVAGDYSSDECGICADAHYHAARLHRLTQSSSSTRSYMQHDLVAVSYSLPMST